jgi:predicted nucleic acid-binding protein
MTLLDDIPEGALVGLDAMIWVYEVESHPVFGPVIRPFFKQRLSAGRNRAGSSLLALGELLVRPVALGRTDLADRFRAAITPSPGFLVWEATRDVVEQAAALRVKYRLKMLDAQHVASAVVNLADIFLTNDEGLRRVTEIRVVILADYGTPASPAP